MHEPPGLGFLCQQIKSAFESLVLGVLIVVPVNQLQAKESFDVGFESVLASVSAGSGGSSSSIKDIDDILPEATASSFGTLGQIRFDGKASAGKAGLKASQITERRPAPFGNSAKGGSESVAAFTDTIVVTPSDCVGEYLITQLSFDCSEMDTSIEVPVTPNFSFSHDMSPEVGVSTDGSTGWAANHVRIEVNYGSQVAGAFFNRCVSREGQDSPQVECDTGNDVSTDGFFNGDVDPDPTIDSGLLIGNGTPTPVYVSPTGSTGSFMITIRLTVWGGVQGTGGIASVAKINAAKTVTYAKTGPVFNLPEGWTAWSTSGLVRNNLWVEPPVFEDGFETMQ